MNEKDMLSQEEIDALLRQSTAQEDSPVENVSDYLTAIEIDAIGEIGNITLGNASTALSSLLRQKVDITTPQVDVVLRNDLDKEFPHPHVAVHVEYMEGFEAINLLVLKMDDARVIADLMLGNDGSNPSDMGDMEISACQEAMNQMMGSAATSMSMLFNKTIQISPPGINILDLPASSSTGSLLNEDVLIRVSFRLIIGNLIDSSIMQLIPISFAHNMVSLLLGGVDSNTTDQPIVNEPIVEELPLDPSTQVTFAQQEPEFTSRQNTISQQASAHTSPQYMGGQSGKMRAPNVQPIQFSNFDNITPMTQQNEQNLNLLLDIPLQVTVELGRTKKLIKEILELGPGSIVELDKLAGEPVDILVNNKLIAKGEVVVIEENFGVRLTEIVSQWERLMKLQ